MASFCALSCGGSGVPTLGSCVVGGTGAWGMDILNMAASCLIAVVLFYPRCGMGVDGVGLCRAYIKSTAALVTASAGYRLGSYFGPG